MHTRQRPLTLVVAGVATAWTVAAPAGGPDYSTMSNEQHLPRPGPSTLTDWEHVQLSKVPYGHQPPAGWEIQQTFDHESGMKATLVHRPSDDKYVLSFAGTRNEFKNGVILKDWTANAVSSSFLSHVLPNTQIEAASSAAGLVQSALAVRYGTGSDSPYHRLEFTGHSAGGRQAISAGIDRGVTSTGVNSPGIGGGVLKNLSPERTRQMIGNGAIAEIRHETDLVGNMPCLGAQHLVEPTVYQDPRNDGIAGQTLRMLSPAYQLLHGIDSHSLDRLDGLMPPTVSSSTVSPGGEKGVSMKTTVTNEQFRRNPGLGCLRGRLLQSRVSDDSASWSDEQGPRQRNGELLGSPANQESAPD